MTDADDVTAIFEALGQPARDDRDRTYAASPGDWRVAKSAEGFAALLVRSPALTRAPILTRHMRADFGARCRVREGETESEEVVTIIECTSTNPDVVRHFLISMSAVLSSLPSPSPSQLEAAVDTLIEIFRAMTRGARTSVQGLWGELYLIAHSSNPGLLLDNWHITANDRHDFASSGQDIEVKTAAGNHRRHRISWYQLQMPSDTTLLVGSIQVDSSAAGATITDLANHALARLDATGEQRRRLLNGVAGALGTDWNAASQQRYDLASARDSVRFYISDAIPTVIDPIPAAVSDVRFTVDLTGVVPVETQWMRAAGGLFAAALPPR